MIPTGLEEWGSILERATVAPTVKITGQVEVAKQDAFGEFQKGARPLESLQKDSHPLLGKRVRHLASGKTGFVKFASHAGGRVIAVEYDDQSLAMNSAEELEVISKS